MEVGRFAIIAITVTVALAKHANSLENNFAENTFQIRNSRGSCLEFNTTSQVFLLKSVCTEHFRWKGGIRLFHVSTGKCLVPQNGNESSLNLTNVCSEANSLFQHDRATNSIKHLLSGMCAIQENISCTGQKENCGIKLGNNCSSENAKFWLVPQVLYIIRHQNGLCWTYAAQNLTRFQNTLACDRFFQRNNKHLQHFETGKCVIFSNNYLRLTDDCSDENTLYEIDENFILHETTSSKCVAPYGGVAIPAVNSLLALTTCANEDRMRMYFADDINVRKIELVSEYSKAHIIVNGHQFSKNTRGINVAVFDYRIGILEHIGAYDVYGIVSHRADLAELLNDLPEEKIVLMSVRGEVSIDDNLALALRRHGVSATFATKNLVKPACTMVAMAYTGKNRKIWEDSVNNINCEGKIHLQKTVYVFHDFKGIDGCSMEMGIRTGKIPDDKMTAKSVWYNYASHASYQGRLYKPGHGWCAKNQSPVSDYLQIDLGVKKVVSGIALQGQQSFPGWHIVTKFKIQYSLDGYNWQYYLNSSGSPDIFKGVQRIIKDETEVIWFTRTLLKIIRVVPVAREALHPYTHCIRMELFGCSPAGPLLISATNSDKHVSDSYNDEISYNGIIALSGNIQIGISNAASQTTLAHDIDQQDISSFNGSVVANNGTVVIKNLVKWSKERNRARGLTISGIKSFQINTMDYYNIDLQFKARILDMGKGNGISSWSVYSYETEELANIIAYPMQVSRKQQDDGHLRFHIQKSNITEYHIGDKFEFNIFTSHWNGRSFSNAYQLETFIYYDANILTLTSLQAMEKKAKYIGMTRNMTEAGFIHMETEVLWLLNRQFIQLEFKFKTPQNILKGSNREGAVIMDIAYKSNLKELNGTAMVEHGILIAYNFSFSLKPTVKGTSSKIPGISIVFDDLNNVLYLCKTKLQFHYGNHQFCYWRNNVNTSWHGIAHIASIVGVDVSKGIVFGLNHAGNSYLKSSENLEEFVCMDDNEWISIKSHENLGLAKKASNSSRLPSNPEESWMFSSFNERIWAATEHGIVQNYSGTWKYILWW